MVRLLERVAELEGLVSSGAGMHEDMKEGLEKHREAGIHVDRMSVALEENALAKKKLEDKLKKKDAQMKDPLAVMSMGFGSMFGAVLGGAPVKEGNEEGSESGEEDDDEDDDDDAETDSSVTGSAEERRDRASTESSSMPLSPSSKAANKTKNGKGGAVVQGLRYQLEQSNEMNQALEQKVHDQQAKLMSLSTTMAELQNVQTALDSKVGQSDMANSAAAAARDEERHKFESERERINQQLHEAQEKTKEEQAERKLAYARLKEAEEVELQLRSAKDELLAAKDQVDIGWWWV